MVIHICFREYYQAILPFIDSKPPTLQSPTNHWLNAYRCVHIYTYTYIYWIINVCAYIYIYVYICIYIYTPKKLDERIPKIRVWTRQLFEIVTILGVSIYIYTYIFTKFQGFHPVYKRTERLHGTEMASSLFRSHKNPHVSHTELILLPAYPSQQMEGKPEVEKDDQAIKWYIRTSWVDQFQLFPYDW